MASIEPADRPLKGRETFPVAWRGDASVDAASRRARQDMHARLALVLQRLVAANLLASHEAAALATPPVKVSVVDLRSGRPVPQRQE